MLCNRVGDVGLILSIGLIIGQKGSYMILFLDRKIVILILVLAAITKSAQIPFSR